MFRETSILSFFTTGPPCRVPPRRMRSDLSRDCLDPPWTVVPTRWGPGKCNPGTVDERTPPTPSFPSRHGVNVPTVPSLDPIPVHPPPVHSSGSTLLRSFLPWVYSSGFTLSRVHPSEGMIGESGVSSNLSYQTFGVLYSPDTSPHLGTPFRRVVVPCIVHKVSRGSVGRSYDGAP